MAYPRIAGRLGEQVNLNAEFYHNGELSAPFSIRQVDIYRGSVRSENLVDTIVIPDGTDSYPLVPDDLNPGSFNLVYQVPDSLVPGDIYYDVWHYVGNDPGTAGVNDPTLWISQPGSFFLYDDTWSADADLQDIDFGFEPLDKHLRRGEVRSIEIAIHPLPLYEYNYNLVRPIIPLLSPTITIHTVNNELLDGLVDAPCTIGIRQGANRNSPYVVKCTIDTKTLLRGTYKYTIKINVRDKVIVSDPYFFTVQ